jgi:hypothetical protein
MLTAWVAVEHGASLMKTVDGGASEPFAFIWFLSWWPWALSHHIDPFYTALVWSPHGLNLAWLTSVPVLSLAMAPVTWAFGPVLSFNLLNLAAPVLAGGSVYALCLYVTGVPEAALAGGWLFECSSYQMSRQNEQLNLEFTALMPCLLLLALARLDGRIGRTATVMLGALVLTCQFGISLEIFATAVVCGGLVWLLAYGMLAPRRAALRLLAVDGVCAAPLFLVLVSPMLWALFALPDRTALPKGWPDFFSTDLFNLIVPTGTDRFGGTALAAFNRHFPGFPSEQSGYLGLPLLAILWAYLRRGHWFSGLIFAGAVLLSCGAHLWLLGRQTGIVLPWALFQHLPLLGNALPSRLMLYAALTAAIIPALWVAEATAGKKRNLRLGACLVAVLCLFPASRPVQPIPFSPFFAPGRVQAILGDHARILILPFGFSSPAAFWQAENHFGFAQAGGYLGYPPVELQGNTSVMRLFFGLDSPDLPAAFAAYCRDTGTQYVVAAPGSAPALSAAMTAIGWKMRQAGDMKVFTVQ